jgi:multimeric flavodoxin WrbA
MKAIIISGSRNPAGQTAKAARSVTAGLNNKDVACVTIYLPVHQIERCRQCDDNGWGLCRREGACIIEDDFAGIVDQLRAADVVVFANPVYYGDLSESLRAFTDRLRRICTQPAGRVGIEKKPAIGVCVAGGGGGGAPECCASLTKVLRTCGFDIVDMIPVRRQNLLAKLPQLEMTGQWLAEKPSSD